MLFIVRNRNTQPRSFTVNSTSLLERVICSTDSVVIVKDISIRLDRPTAALAVKFSSLLADFGCVQWVTAVIHDAGGLLDTMISRSNNSQLDPDVNAVGLADHRFVSAYIDFTPSQPLFETRTSRA